MIIDSFDPNSKPFITAEGFYGTIPRNEVITLVTFKEKVVEYIKEKYGAKLSKSYKTTNGNQDIYSFELEGKTYQIYCSGIGATLASILMKEVSVVTGSHRFIYFGSCGVLNEEACRGKIIVPISSYRDEGVSYHYMAPTDYVDIRNHFKIETVLKNNNIPYVTGPIWTTDAIYMETVNKVNKHKEDGCIAVEMEVSGVEAVARYYDLDNYHILFSADSLDALDKWERVDMGGDNELKLQIEAFEVALLIAQNL